MKLDRVSFSQMIDGTREDFEIIAANDDETAKDLPRRIIEHLKLLDEDDGAYHISRLGHSLQTATRVERDGGDDDWIVAALIHDIGDVLAPFTHANVAYEIIRPFVREEIAWTVKNHGIFQMFYNKSLDEKDRNLRNSLKDSPHYHVALHFVESYDQSSFDPAYETFPLEHFLPKVEKVFSREPFSQ